MSERDNRTMTDKPHKGLQVISELRKALERAEADFAAGKESVTFTSANKRVTFHADGRMEVIRLQ